MMAVSLSIKLNASSLQHELSKSVSYYVPVVSQMVSSIFVLVFRLFNSGLSIVQHQACFL